MLNVKEYIQNGITYTDIYLTRGDAAELVLPIYQVASDGTKTPYTPSGSDTFAVQVRKQPIVGTNTTPAVVINGTVAVDNTDHKPHWTISSANSTIDVGEYYWDAQITTSSKPYTFYTGRFIIMPEVTT